MQETKFIILGKRKITLTKIDHGFWEDDKGTIYAYYDHTVSTDSLARCGVNPLALPLWPIFKRINEACKPHDFMYQDRVYQAFHTEKEANEALEKLVEQAGFFSFLAVPFKILADTFGGLFWEGKR